MNEHAHVYDYLTVGAGPAGLAFASTIKHPNSLVIDLGKLAPLRDRNHSVDCAHGYGGAGLFSDGKFSFYPSGSGLWKCKGNELRMAYRHLEQDLGPYCVLPPFPQISAEPQP
ncbi:MAG: hypothetical protein KDK78_06665, partial [Chlamydiia bacterium]|nr:hypothetical protein [Chlamydiia bacterium]